MRIFLGVPFFACCFFVSQYFHVESKPSIGLETAVEYFKENSSQFSLAAHSLQSAVMRINEKDSATIVFARAALRNCRVQYKKIEFFLEYFFRSTAVNFNGPPKYEIEEPYMEWQTPTGLQVIEAILYEKNMESKKAEILEQTKLIYSSAHDLNALLYDFSCTDAQLLESMRQELVRVYTLCITGFDAPLLKSGIEEAYASLDAVRNSLSPFLKTRSIRTDSISYYLQSCLDDLAANKDFDSFDRLSFFTLHALPLQMHLGLYIREANMDINTSHALDYNAKHLFSADAINIGAFSPDQVNNSDALIALGKKLFFETGLSGNNKISCATCHKPEKYFSDGLQKSMAFDGHSTLKRNAPSLLYAAYQYAQFWDGRAKTLEQQIIEVLNNSSEMNSSPGLVEQQLNSNTYHEVVSETFQKNDSNTALNKTAVAIAAFVRSLHPMNSAFDQYVNGNENAMNNSQVRGFNLFMGKAQCGTCHFAPLFNGLVPPLYDRTEVEVLGTTKTENFSRPAIDDDNGRYDIFSIDFYKQAFKTPTVRNVSETAPYMHNGAFSTLENLIQFYNKGGGRGLGLNIQNQTLSSMPLQLNPAEVTDIVNFLHALKDASSTFSVHN